MAEMISPLSSDQNHARIVGAATRVFFQRGFHRVPVDTLAKELGMSKKTLYTSFESKNSLLEEVLRNLTRQIEEELGKVLEKEESFPEKFRNFIRYFHRKMSQIHPSFLEDVRRHAPNSWGIVEEFRSRMIPVYFGRLLEDGIKEGFLRSDLNRELFLRLLLGAVQGMMNPTAIMESGMSPIAIIDGMMSILFEGILTPAGRRKFQGSS